MPEEIGATSENESPIDLAKLRETISGDSTFSLGLFFPLFCVALPLSLFGERQDITTMHNALLWGVIHLSGYLFTWILWTSIKEVKDSLGVRFTHWWPLFFLSGLGGAINALIVANVLPLTSMDYSISLWGRLSAGFFSFMIWLPLETVILSGRKSFEQFEKDSINDLLNQERIRILQTDLISLVRVSIEGKLRRDLGISAEKSSSLLKLERLKERKESRASEVLQELATKDLQVLSQELMSLAMDMPEEEVDRKSKETKLFRAFRVGTNSEPINLFLLTICSAIIQVPLTIRNFGFHDGIVASVFFFIVMFLCTAIANQIFRSSNFSGIAVFIGWACGLFVVFLILYSQRLHIRKSMDLTHFAGLGWIPWVIFVIAGQVIFNVGKASFISQARAMDVFSEQIKMTSVRQNIINLEIATVSRDWAKQLHGPIRAELLATALMLERAQASGDEKEMDLVLQQAVALLDSLVQAAPLEKKSAVQEIEYRVSLWEPLVDITADLSGFTHLPESSNSQDLGGVIEEAISNAVRHAMATSISIVLKNEPSGELVIEVVNDGMWKDLINPGVGSALYSIYSDEHWTISRNPTTRLTTLRLSVS
ncbi:unannotated protein [freshwater metagenome]|uniref:Unannotated protein n=1 Tax=freshwater metagenome TaxID=449393 RepID=A0A6J6VD26_9ZZZZ|nr:hypothetical protein [Actinomycetota bacterium]